MNLYVHIFGSVLLVSLLSLAGVAFLAMQEQKLRKMLLYLVSFSTGAILAAVFLHLIPEMISTCSDLERAMFFVLVGLILSFVIERFIHWHHCHTLECEKHIHPAGPMLLIGDALHNLVDGILIATSYSVSIPLGITTTFAVILHELPQEIGDFAVLLHCGYSKGKALLFNFLSALTAVLGALLFFVIEHQVHNVEAILLPIATGNFLYIATADLIPQLHKETKISKSLIQFIWLIAGIALLSVFSNFGPSHEHSHDGHHDNEHIEPLT